VDFSFLRRRSRPALILGFLLAVVGAAGLPLALNSVYDSSRLADPDATSRAVGHILRMHISSGRGGRSYYLDYTYQVGRLAVRVRNLQIGEENWTEIGHGDVTIPVTFLNSDPAVSEPALPGEEEFAIWHAWLFLACSLGILVLGYWQALFNGNGEIHPGKIIRHRKAT